MKRLVLFLSCFAIVVFLLGCAALTNTLVREVVYDSTIAESEMTELFLQDSIRITSFNGKSVIWSGPSKIKIPAGEHNFTLNYISSHTFDTFSKYGKESYVHRIISNQGNIGIALPSANFEAGHRYFFRGNNVNINSRASTEIFVEDVTYQLNSARGDIVKIPATSSIATKFQGTWKSDDGIVFIFNGNSWESKLPPKTWDNGYDYLLERKGNFEFDDNNIIIYYRLLGGIFGSNAYIYEYSLDGGHLTLELKGFLQKTNFIKQ